MLSCPDYCGVFLNKAKTTSSVGANMVKKKISAYCDLLMEVGAIRESLKYGQIDLKTALERLDVVKLNFDTVLNDV